MYPPGNMGTCPEPSQPLPGLELLLRAGLEHSQTLRSGRGVQEGRDGGTVLPQHPRTTHPPAPIARGSRAPLTLWGMLPPAGSISSPHPHAQHTALMAQLGQEEEKAAGAATS